MCFCFIIGVPPKPLHCEYDHSYSKSQLSGPPAGAVHSGPSVGHTTLLTVSDQDSVVLSTDKPIASTTIGRSVRLLCCRYKPVGTAITMSGDVLHGHAVPDGFTKVSVVEIKPSIKPMVQFGGDEDLSKGCITAWPLTFM